MQPNEQATSYPGIVRSSADAILHKLTDAEVEAFKARGVAVQIASPNLGELWLVPEYTGRDRHELSIEHAATLAMLCSAFPGAQVVAFEKSRPESLSPT